TQMYYAYYDKNHFANSIVALSAEYSVYIPLFALLFYIDNRHRYIDPPTGKRDFKTIRSDIKKLFTAFSISEIAFSLSNISFIYEFLQLEVPPYQASMFGSIAASIISFALVNVVILQVVMLFKD